MENMWHCNCRTYYKYRTGTGRAMKWTRASGGVCALSRVPEALNEH